MCVSVERRSAEVESIIFNVREWQAGRLNWHWVRFLAAGILNAPQLCVLSARLTRTLPPASVRSAVLAAFQATEGV